MIRCHKSQQNAAVHNHVSKGNKLDLWMEVVNRDLKRQKIMLAHCALLPEFKEEELLREYANILLHQVLKTAADGVGRRCPGPCTASEAALSRSKPMPWVLPASS